MDTEIQKWSEVLEELKQYEITSTLLGNGFSIAWDKESFSQQGLKPPCIQNLDYCDAETCIKELLEGMNVMENETLRAAAQKIVQSKIHSDFLRILCDKLPERFGGEKARPFVEYLKLFKSIFVLNYDPLTYLLINKFRKIANPSRSITVKSEKDSEKEIISEVISDFILKSSWHILIDGVETIIENSAQQKRTVLVTKLIEVLHHDNRTKKFIEKYVSGQQFIKEHKAWFNCKVSEYLNMPVSPELSVLQFHDGFTTKGDTTYWSPDNEQSFFHLHGAFHIVKHVDENGTESIQKLTASGKHSMIEQLHLHLDNGDLPISILEGTTERKLQAIRENPYMNACYEALCMQQGVIVTLGVSFAENDSHIADAIIKNIHLVKVYIGLFKHDGIAAELERLKKLFKPIQDKVVFFESNNTLK